MLIKTHFLITIIGILILISNVEHKVVFVIVALMATFIPDIDSRYSVVGRRKINRILQFFTKHRGITHSFVFLILITVLLVYVLPIIALGFFLGYGLHLFGDSFTLNGIQAFYPISKKKASGPITTGRKFEKVLFVILLFLALFILWVKIF